MDITKMWDFLCDEGIATDEELKLVTTLNGYKEDVLTDVLYVRTGYRDFEQYKESEMPSEKYYPCDDKENGYQCPFKDTYVGHEDEMCRNCCGLGVYEED